MQPNPRHPGSVVRGAGKARDSHVRTVRAAVESRRKQLGLPPDAFTARAVAALDRLSGGQADTLESLLTATLAAAGDGRIAAHHVDEAARGLRTPAPPPPPMTRTALDLLAEADAPVQAPWRAPRVPRAALAYGAACACAFLLAAAMAVLPALRPAHVMTLAMQAITSRDTVHAAAPPLTLAAAVQPPPAVVASAIPPAPAGMPVPTPAPVPAATGDAAKAQRLYALGLSLLSIGQGDDARTLFLAAAHMGNADASAQVRQARMP